ncbi:unnamed protein product [Coregonus sp. 'balchen']|nr:unnamed protein product [Coregonus sp. 'balchen']
MRLVSAQFGLLVVWIISSWGWLINASSMTRNSITGYSRQFLPSQQPNCCLLGFIRSQTQPFHCSVKLPGSLSPDREWVCDAVCSPSLRPFTYVAVCPRFSLEPSRGFPM